MVLPLQPELLELDASCAASCAEAAEDAAIADEDFLDAVDDEEEAACVAAQEAAVASASEELRKTRAAERDATRHANDALDALGSAAELLHERALHEAAKARTSPCG